MNVNAILNRRIGFCITGLIIFLMVSPVLVFSQSRNITPSAQEIEADTLLNRGDFESAIATYSKLIKKKTASSQVLYKRAYAYFNLERYQEALADVNVYISQSNDPQGIVLRATIHEQTGNYADELHDINLLMAQSVNPELVRWRASIAMEAGQYAVAQQDIQQLLKWQHSTELLSFLGLTYYYQEKADSALTIFNQVITEAPELLETYLYAGALCLEEGEIDLSLQYINAGLARDPRNATLLFYKGAALVEKDDFDEGCRCLIKAFTNGIDEATDYLKEYCYGVE